ncbi:MAG: OmpH family outer membrane protein [Pseudomonadota bacterium]
MQKQSITRWLAAAILIAGTAVAGTAAAELNVAVLDTQRAVAESEEAKDFMKRINRELKSEQDEAKTLGDNIRKLTEKLEKDGEVMSASQRRKTQSDIEEKQLEYQFTVNKLQKQVNDRRNELLQEMVPKLDAVLKDLIEEERFDLVLERGSLRYSNPKHDITRKVTELLNKRR